MEYKEILRLKEMLDKANIPFTFTDDFFEVKDDDNFLHRKALYPAYQIRLECGVDVIEYNGSIGCKKDLLEIMGALTEEESEDDCVLGNLTAEEVFKRFKYCYENNTSVYKDESVAKPDTADEEKLIEEMATESIESAFFAELRNSINDQVGRIVIDIPTSLHYALAQKYYDIVKRKIDETRKQTAKEILQIWYKDNQAKGEEQDFVLELAEKYGVEVEE